MTRPDDAARLEALAFLVEMLWAERFAALPTDRAVRLAAEVRRTAEGLPHPAPALQAAPMPPPLSPAARAAALELLERAEARGRLDAAFGGPWRGGGHGERGP